MKPLYIILIILIPFKAFPQWNYAEYTDSIENEKYAIAYNKNLRIEKTYNFITLSLLDTNLQTYNRTVKLSFISNNIIHSFITTSKIYKGNMLISYKLNNETYIKHFKYADKIIIQILQDNYNKTKTYVFYAKNTLDAYNFIVTH